MGMTEPAILSPTTGSKGADPIIPSVDSRTGQGQNASGRFSPSPKGDFDY